MPMQQYLNFQQAFEYLKSRGHPMLSMWAFRTEVKNYPERFGAMRRNPLAKRGRGGMFYFTKANLNKYRSLQSV